jgi:hypothetical protein
MPSESKQEWQQGTYAKSVARVKERSPKFQLTSGIEQEPLYTPDDLNG